ncbi:MBL fold metallo-hydrolase [Bacillus sp. PS06]|uniref:MBL fold metallo-hydrolase n=1 Tax=Bacillus sp. PS06 TaxID=2764176 RepID=UPI00177D96F5|nr:MBL fold metallo-hydrolase [Bacillus sp. PS06]MBD8070091.1 MBL fold metallo-hydrolase [Bacillus sp. PS06]
MRVTRFETVYQLAFLPRFFPVNCYLVEEESELTLIDAGLPFSAKGILAAAREMEKPITNIVLTHAHEDHVGALDQLKMELPAADVYISTRDAKIMKGDRSLEEGEPITPIKGGVPKNLKTEPTILLNEGDRIGSIEAIYTPGHTPGSMAFLDTRNRAVIAGDAFQIQGGIAVAGKVQPFFPFPAFGTWNKEMALKSAIKIAGLKPSVLAVGHGRMLEQPQHLMEQAIKEAEEKFA